MGLILPTTPPLSPWLSPALCSRPVTFASCLLIGGTELVAQLSEAQADWGPPPHTLEELLSRRALSVAHSAPASSPGHRPVRTATQLSHVHKFRVFPSHTYARHFSLQQTLPSARSPPASTAGREDTAHPEHTHTHCVILPAAPILGSVRASLLILHVGSGRVLQAQLGRGDQVTPREKTLVACRGTWQMEGGRGWVLGEA